MKIYAGFDSGGTSTRCLLADEQGNILGVGKGGPSNFLFCGRELAAASIKDSLNEAFRASGCAEAEISGMFIASAAVEVFGGEDHAGFFREVTGCPHVECDSDIFPVWFGGGLPRFAPAICTIAGTGAVTYLLSGSRFVKSSGWGPLFGDEGSGYDIGQKALKLCSCMSDLREPMDPEFYGAVLKHYQVDEDHPRRLLRAAGQPREDGLGQDYRSRAASVTRVVDQLAVQGNASARRLFDEAAEDVVRSVEAVIRRSGQEDPYDYHEKDSGETFNLVLSGGLFRPESPLTLAVKEKLAGNTRISDITLPRVPAVQSAAAIALFRASRQEAAERLMEESYE